MMKILSLVSLLLLATFGVAQNEKKLFVTVDYQVKFTMGEPSSQTIQGNYLQYSFENQLSYSNPVNQITFTVNYQLGKSFSIGLGSGLNVSKYVLNPSRWNNFYNKVGVPLFLQGSYSILSKEKWTVLSNLYAGYQFSDAYHDHFNYEWTSTESGGFMTGLDFHIALTKQMYSPFLIIGYEYNQFNNRRLVWVNGITSISEDVEFKTFCHLLKVGIGLKF